MTIITKWCGSFCNNNINLNSLCERYLCLNGKNTYREMKTKMLCIFCLTNRLNTTVTTRKRNAITTTPLTTVTVIWKTRPEETSQDRYWLTLTHSHIFVRVICILPRREKTMHSGEKLEDVHDRKLCLWISICISMLAQSLTVCHVDCVNLSWYKGL